jgi:hypothetical protein
MNNYKIKTAAGSVVMDREQLDQFITIWKSKPEQNKLGILIMGKTGTGKTTAMKRIRSRIYGASQLESKLRSYEKGYSKPGHEDWYVQNYQIALDDFGSLPGIDSFGNERFYLSWIFDLYDAWEDRRQYLVRLEKWRTSVEGIGIVKGPKSQHPIYFLGTSNLTDEQLEEVLGERLWERIKQITYRIILDDTNLRDVDTNYNL